jgi:release factor glutamine methyltransferase
MAEQNIPEHASLATALYNAAKQLMSVSETPRLDAELLAAHVLGLGRMEMLARLQDLTAPTGYAELIDRRLTHEPVAYITGIQPFWDLDLHVTPAVLIPRSDSETLIEASLEAYTKLKYTPRHILDLGTGSGALLLAALSAFPTATGVGIDASNTAIGVAKDNATRCGMSGRVSFARINWRHNGWVEQALQRNRSAELVEVRLSGKHPSAGSGLRSITPRSFDLILANPPYIATDTLLDPMVTKHEPHEALFAGADGLDDYHILLPALPALLASNGIAIFEIGFDQAESVSDIARTAGLEPSLRLDLSGNPRALVLKRME